MENTCFGVSLSIKLQFQACNFIEKKTPTQVFLCWFCKIFKNTFFYWAPSVESFCHLYSLISFLKLHRVCVCVCLHPSTVKALSVWIRWDTRERINDIMLKTLISYAKALYRYFNIVSTITYNIVVSVDIVNGVRKKSPIQTRGVFRTLSINERLVAVTTDLEERKQIPAETYFCKKTSWKIFERLLNTPLRPGGCHCGTFFLLLWAYLFLLLVMPIFSLINILKVEACLKSC